MKKTYDPQLARLLDQITKRGYTPAKFAVVCERAYQQRIEGDKEYNRSPRIHTILRRVLDGEYDYLFN